MGFYDREQNIPVISDRKFSALIGMVLSNHSTTFGQYLLSMTKNVSDDPINADFFHTVSERYLFPSEDDFTGTIGDEGEWILERFTDRRLRWVYIFTDEDYDRAKAMYDERMANYGSGEK